MSRRARAAAFVVMWCASLTVAWGQVAPGAERWQQYRDGLLAKPGLVRLYAFDQVADSTTLVPDLVGGDEPLAFVPLPVDGGEPVDDLEVVPGRWAGTTAVALDQGAYRTTPFDVTDRHFTAECWLRNNGPGTLRPRGKNGTLMGTSSGYSEGWRITLSEPGQRVSFAIGRPKPVFAISTSCSSPAPAGSWTHLAVTWNGQMMRTFINGVMRAEQAYDGEYTPARGAREFRLGYSAHGVGSFKLDLGLVALYDRALTTDEIALHANPEADLEVELIAAVRRGDELLAAGRFDDARHEYATIAGMTDDGLFAPLANYRVMARLRIADSLRAQERIAEARESHRAIADDEDVPGHYRMTAWLALADTHTRERNYSAARAEYERIAAATTGSREHYRVEVLARLAEIETLADGAPLVGLRRRRLDRISRPAVTLYVATDGDDANTGTQEQPLATLGRARDAIRELKQAGPLPAGGVAVMLRGGIYPLGETFALGEEDSGTDAAPIVYRSFPGEEVRLSGGAEVTGFAAVTDPAALARLPEEARGHVVVADLQAQGLTDYGEILPRGYGRPVTPSQMELFVGGRPMELARWPNKSPRMSEGFVTIHDLLLTNSIVFRGDDVDKDLHFIYDGDRPDRWVNEPDVWLYGYWAVEYAAQYQKIASIDTERRVFELEGPNVSYGLRKGRPYYALNLLPELDSPGEYYVDRQAGRLYLWPPDGGDLAATVSLLADPLVTMNGVSHVVMRGMVLECGRADGVLIEGGAGNLIAGCVVRNLGNTGVIVEGGSGHGVLGCDVYDVGDGGIYLSGGDRNTLMPAGHFAENNHLHRFSRWDRAGYRSGLKLSGVGCRASHNLIHDCPHHAVNIRQNDHVLEYNEIHDTCYEAAEMGCYYIWAGRDSFSWQGNVVRYNFFHHLAHSDPFPRIRTGGPGLHIDALNGAIAVYGNVFHAIAQTAVFNGGGRDNVVANNIFNHCGTAVVMADRSSMYPSFSRPDDMPTALAKLPYQEPPWSERYPLLVGILDDDPGLPKNNLVERDINVGQFMRRHGAAHDDAFTIVRDNWDADDPGFADASGLDFRIAADSPVYGRIGFEAIPVERIGLYEDELRATWPVVHEVGARRVSDAHYRRRENVPTVAATRRVTEIAIDGRLDAAEWGDLDRERAMVLERNPRNLEGAGPKSWAWLRYDDEALYVAVLSEVVPDHDLQVGTQWGTHDSVEIAIEGQMGELCKGWWMLENEHGPIFMLIGNTVGEFEVLQVGGLPAVPAGALEAATDYGASVIDRGLWSAEWRIPLRAACVDPKRLDQRPFNIGVRKTAGPASVSEWRPGEGPAGWVVWVGTGSRNWEVWNAGLLDFAR